MEKERYIAPSSLNDRMKKSYDRGYRHGAIVGVAMAIIVHTLMQVVFHVL